MPEFELVTPIGGLDRGALFRQQPPYTTPDCLNVRPRQLHDKRFGLSVRPGLGRAFPDQIGSGNPVRMLSSVGIVETQGADQLNDHFNGDVLATTWTATGPYFRRGYFRAPPSGAAAVDPISMIGVNAGASATLTRSTMDVDDTYGYQVSIYIVPDRGISGATYRLATRLNNSSPNVVNDSVYIDLALTAGGAYSFNVVVNKSAATTVLATGSSTHSYDHPGWLTLEIFRDDSGTPTREHIRAYWRGTALVDPDTTFINKSGDPVTGMPSHTTHRRAYVLLQGDTRAAYVDQFRIRRHYPPASSGSGAIRRRRQAMVAAANGVLYVETTVGRIVQASSQSNLQSDRRIYAAELLQKLYIADNGPILLDHFSGDATITGTINLAVVGNPYNFVSLGVDPNIHVVEVYHTSITGTETDGDATADVGVYPISTVLTTSILLAHGTTLNRSAVRFRIVRGPKVYDPVAGTFTVMRANPLPGSATHNSSQPINAQLIWTYRDRLRLARTDEAPHAHYASRVGDPGDWDYDVSDTDPQRPYAGTNLIGGQISKAITAGFSHTDDYEIIATISTMHIGRGDPTAGGSFDIYSDTIGIVAPGAKCKLPDDSVIILSRDGLYAIPRGAQGDPVRLSQKSLPTELLDIEYPEYEVSMAYDRINRGVEIWVRPRTGPPRQSYFFHIDSGGFWPQRCVQQAHEPESIHYYDADLGDDAAVLIGASDGYIRRYRDCFHNDDGTHIPAHVVYGPSKLGAPEPMFASLDKLRGILNEEMGGAKWSVQAASTEQLSLKARPCLTGHWRPGRNRDREIRRGGAICVRVENEGGYFRCESGEYFVTEAGDRLALQIDDSAMPWSIEAINGVKSVVGEQREA